jgi:hypothetical protein
LAFFEEAVHPALLNLDEFRDQVFVTVADRHLAGFDLRQGFA